MITHYRLKNFKVFKDSGWLELRPITYIMGNNSAGKSSIIKSLQFIKQFFEQNDPQNMVDLVSQNVDLGAFKDTSHHGSDCFSLHFRITPDYISRQRHHLDTNKLSEIYPGNQFELNMMFGPVDKDTSSVARLIGLTIKIDGLNEIFNLDMKNFNKMKAVITPGTPIGNRALKELNRSKMTHPKRLVPNDIRSLNSKIIKQLELMSIEGTTIALAEKSLRLSPYAGINNVERYVLMAFRIYQHETSKSVYSIIADHFNGDMHSIYAFLRDVGRSGGAGVYSYEALLESQKIDGKENEEDAAAELQWRLQRQIAHWVSSESIAEIIKSLYDEIQSFAALSSSVSPVRASPSRLFWKADNNLPTIWNKILKDPLKREKIIFVNKFIESANFGEKLNISPQKDLDSFFRITMGDGSNQRDLIDLGFGTSQILPILFQCIVDNDLPLSPRRIGGRKYKKEQSLIAIEQPEIHLHPAAQAALAPYFIRVTKEYNKILFIETHSEHMILKSQVEVKKSPELADKIIIHFVSKHREKNSFSDVTSLTIDQDGLLSEPFPDDFFDLSYELNLELLP